MSILINKIVYELKLRTIPNIHNQLTSYTKQKRDNEIISLNYNDPDLVEFFAKIQEYTRVHGRRQVPTIEELKSMELYLKQATIRLPRERKAIILLGLPGAGKSTSIRKIGISTDDYFTVDSDIYKSGVMNETDKTWSLSPLQQSYLGGVDVEHVHEVSAKLAKLSLIKILEAGINVVIPKVGNSIKGLKKLVKQLNENDYSIEIVYVHATISTCLKRNLSRYLSINKDCYPRIVNPKLIFDFGYRPMYNFFKIEISKVIGSFIMINNEKNTPSRIYFNFNKKA